MRWIREYKEDLRRPTLIIMSWSRDWIDRAHDALGNQWTISDSLQVHTLRYVWLSAHNEQKKMEQSITQNPITTKQLHTSETKQA